MAEEKDINDSTPNHDLVYLKTLLPRAKVELEICRAEIGYVPPILSRLVNKLEEFINKS